MITLFTMLKEDMGLPLDTILSLFDFGAGGCHIITSTGTEIHLDSGIQRRFTNKSVINLFF